MATPILSEYELRALIDTVTHDHLPRVDQTQTVQQRARAQVAIADTIVDAVIAKAYRNLGSVTDNHVSTDILLKVAKTTGVRYDHIQMVLRALGTNHYRVVPVATLEEDGIAQP